MEILHVTAECFPVAKVGGLGDVVGALPKYQTDLGHAAKVIMPMYRTEFLYENNFDVMHKGAFQMGSSTIDYTIIKEKTDKLGFELYLVDIFNMLDREKVYGYDDDTERFTAFQISVVDWLHSLKTKPDVVHVHDHHAALIPFMMQHCNDYKDLSAVHTVLTIHNAQYQGWMSWDKGPYIPTYDMWRWGLLDWDKMINPLACGIRCAIKVTTVSPGYLEELQLNAKGLERLFQMEKHKCFGILNGIDEHVWNPKTDKLLKRKYSVGSTYIGKPINKKELCKEFGLTYSKPLIVFIGRLVDEKAADLLPAAIEAAIQQGNVNFLILGSGNKNIEQQFYKLNNEYAGYYNSMIGYNEKLSHLMYAGADFLLMPSRVEPCGLNQMYAMRYGTIPIVRSTGGLKDTVIDIGEEGGFGISFNNATVSDIVYSIHRATELYKDSKKMSELRKTIMEIDHTWHKSADEYIKLYKL
jgi:starch synthase